MTKVKNVLELIHQPTGTMITFCYSAKAHREYMKEQFSQDDELYCGGRCNIVTKGSEFRLVVSIRKNKDVYALKALMVHELSHCVTELMNEYNFDCDEFRSYTLQWLYQEIMPSLDARLQKDYKKK